MKSKVKIADWTASGRGAKASSTLYINVVTSLNGYAIGWLHCSTSDSYGKKCSPMHFSEEKDHYAELNENLPNWLGKLVKIPLVLIRVNEIEEDFVVLAANPTSVTEYEDDPRFSWWVNPHGTIIRDWHNPPGVEVIGGIVTSELKVLFNDNTPK